MKPRSLFLGLISTALLGWTPVAMADNSDTLRLLTEPLDIPEVTQFRLGQVPTDGSVVTAATISQASLTVPSLWWAEEQFGGKLLDYWVAYTGANDTLRRVDVLVNPQIWVRYSYLERYAFINHLGKSAGDFGFSTRIFSWQGDLIGAYLCEFDSAASPNFAASTHAEPGHIEAERCRVFLETTGAGALSGSNPASPLPTNGDTAR